MPLSYTRDDTARRIRITSAPPVTADEVIAAIDRQVSEGTWQYSVLADLRLAFVPPPEVARIIVHLQEMTERHGPASPVAFVARDATAIGSAHKFGRNTIDLGIGVQIFWDLDEAVQWLDTLARRDANSTDI